MERIAVAMSGGIDSLTAAFLLKREGFHVFGIHFITGFEPADQSQGDFETLSRKLHIPIETIDLRQDFQRRVVDYFAASYKAGQTPNPCLKCNAEIKFGVLLQYARNMGANALATGHYARIIHAPDGSPRLCRGTDRTKDQSYFLAFLAPDQLARARFPLGRMTKQQVRELAKQNDLAPLILSESQDVCFIRNRTYTEFLMQHADLSPQAGPITDIRGNIVGRHDGLHRFTIGQRRGINCPAKEPFYVIRLDAPDNTLVVGSRNDLKSGALRVRDINWIAPPAPGEIRVQTQIRYRHRAAASKLVLNSDAGATIVFDELQEAVTPGQAAVFYQDEIVIGGGIIESPLREAKKGDHAGSPLQNKNCNS